MSAWACQSEHHVGDRTRVHPHDRYAKRITYVRADGKERLFERTVPDPNRCRACVKTEAGMTPDPNQLTLT